MISTREHEGVDGLLEHLLETGNLGSFASVLNVHFHFPQRSQGPWLDKLDERFALILEQKIIDSENGHDIYHCVVFCGYVLSHEKGFSEKSSYRLVGAAQVLQNAAWHPNANLSMVVRLADKTAWGNYPLMARENAVDALKNAAYFQGEHVPAAVESALNCSNSDAIRMQTGCVRTIAYAAAHSHDLLKTAGVASFLQRMEKSRNSFVRENATGAYAAIFGK